MECSRGAAVTISGVARLDAESLSRLHEIRLRGVVQTDDTVIARLVEVGYVMRSNKGVRITIEGRELHTVWARLPAGSDAETAARRAYERFLPLNRELVRICHDWQVTAGGANDHTDLRYDWSVIDRLRSLDERAAPVVSRLARTVTRFAEYRPRLRTALARVDDGDAAWLTSPRCDSYHTVWMRLHEDLLLALGADRGAEPDPEQA